MLIKVEHGKIYTINDGIMEIVVNFLIVKLILQNQKNNVRVAFNFQAHKNINVYTLTCVILWRSSRTYTRLIRKV